MSAKKVLLIIPEMTTGGAQRSLSKLSLELSQHFQVWLVVFNRETPVMYKHGGELLNLGVVPDQSLFGKFKAFRKRISALRKIKKNLQIDVAISFLEGADYVNILSRNREKVILSIRGSKIHDVIMHSTFFWLRSKLLIPQLYKKADAIVSVNEGIANELTDYYGLEKEKIQIIGNFYDAEAITKLSIEKKPGSLQDFYKHPVLVSIGRLNREKGLEHVIRIFSKLKSSLDNLKMVVVGDGPEKEKLISLSTHLGLKSSIHLEWTETPDVVFTGNQENVFKFLNSAALFVMNSSSEGFPNGIVEAMLCHVTVATSNCPYGPAEILAPNVEVNSGSAHITEHGILLPIAKDDTTENIWVEKLLQVLKNESLRRQLSEKAFLRASEFKKENVIDQWLKLIYE